MDSEYRQRIETQERAALERFRKSAARREARFDPDWRKVEDPLRLPHRLDTLGLDALTAGLIASDEVAAPVPSATGEGAVTLLERIIQQDDLQPARFLLRGAEMTRAVGRIRIRSGVSDLGFGTGFLVAPRVLMTNHHVLPDGATARNSKVEFDYYEREDGRAWPTQLYGLEPDLFFLTDPRLDFSIVAVRPESSDGQRIETRGRVALVAESGKALVREPVFIIQHPLGKPQAVVFDNNEILAVVDDFLHYVADTERGSSGSPVFNLQWQLAALHHAGVPRVDAEGRILLRSGQPWDHSNDTAGDIAWEANEGTRVSSLVTHLSQIRAQAEPAVQQWLDTVLDAAGPAAGTTQPAHSVADLPAAPAIAPNRHFESLPVTPSAKVLPQDVDSWTMEDVSEALSRYERSLESAPAAEFFADRPYLVAEGDSWFDYAPAGLDIISCLRLFHGYRIDTVAKAGDTLDNMAWGTDYDRQWHRDRPQLEKTLAAVRKRRPRVVLLSGGGNDVAGEELSAYLNHRDSGGSALRESYAATMIGDYYAGAFRHIARQIWSVEPEAQLLLHGYGHVVADGRAVLRFPFGFQFIGPWLRPALTAKGYDQRSLQDPILRTLIDRFNDMLAALAASDSRLHYLDLRPLIGPDDWANELHLRNSAYQRVARLYAERIAMLTA